MRDDKWSKMDPPQPIICQPLDKECVQEYLIGPGHFNDAEGNLDPRWEFFLTHIEKGDDVGGNWFHRKKTLQTGYNLDSDLVAVEDREVDKILMPMPKEEWSDPEKPELKTPPAFKSKMDKKGYNAEANCLANGVKKGRTMSFVTAVYCEMMRAYTVKSNRPAVFTFLTNGWMHIACTISAVLTLF